MTLSQQISALRSLLAELEAKEAGCANPQQPCNDTTKSTVSQLDAQRAKRALIRLGIR